ncbi:MAG TPA: hypothetical protein VFN36_05090 [Solirubrobacteraceae bacterium]|nr:hypothetical protein [Solirubrobacteraceae bacterium]
MRALRVLSVVLSVMVIALGEGAPSQAQAVRGLTKVEFRQLTLAQRRIRTLESSDARSLSRAHQVCARLLAVSPLISAVRTGCLDLVRLGGDRSRLNARAIRCGIDPGTAVRLLDCLVPAVEGFQTDATAFHRQELLVNRMARARGFDAACVAVIGDSPANIAAEGRLAADLGAAVRALKTQSPLALETLTSQLESVVRSIRPGPTSLALCPHA